MAKTTKVITRRKKFIKIAIPLIHSEFELLGNSPEEAIGRGIKLDLTRQLKGKSIEATFKINKVDDDIIAVPKKIRLMPYFIRRMIRKRISYIEDSFIAKTLDSQVKIKPFLITRKRVSRAVRKTLRNKTKNYLEDYLKDKTNDEIFSEILSNKIQRPLSLMLKKTYPLSLCEIRVFEVIKPLTDEEKKSIKKSEKKEEENGTKKETQTISEEITSASIKEAESEIKETQNKASKIQATVEEDTEKPKKKATKKTVAKRKQ